jgi:hypothetical protein
MTTATIRQYPDRAIGNEGATHLFAIGQAVRWRGGFRGPFRAAGIFRVTGRLPPAGSSPQYRIRSDAEAFERVTTEDALQAAPLAAEKSTPLIEETFGRGHDKHKRPEVRARKRRVLNWHILKI